MIHPSSSALTLTPHPQFRCFPSFHFFRHFPFRYFNLLRFPFRRFPSFFSTFWQFDIFLFDIFRPSRNIFWWPLLSNLHPCFLYWYISIILIKEVRDKLTNITPWLSSLNLQRFVSELRMISYRKELCIQTARSDRSIYLLFSVT